jgi:hypothetical protein
VVGGYFGCHLQHDGRKGEVRLNGINERWLTNMSHRRGGEGGISGGDSKFGESGDTLATAGGQMSLGS